MSEEMKEFITKLDKLCCEYGYEIWPTRKINSLDEDGAYPTFTIHGDDEKVSLTFIDGDGVKLEL